MGDKHYETLDSFDYLIPPVKNSYETIETDLLFSRDFQRRTDIRLIEDLRKRIAQQIKSSFVTHESLQTSSSVILKKTDEVIIEPYVFGNPKNKNCITSKLLPPFKKRRKLILENKPMIKVTVVPREAETQTSKVFSKRRERTVKLQSTVSNQENSTTRQNAYFMVKRKLREKVCEIKSSESTNLSNKFFNEKYEDTSISRKQIRNSKRLLSSLDMEKKKHKNKKTEQNTHNTLNTDDIWQNINNFKDSQDVNARKSKVTIVGQLGLTRDEQYVLKCAATVNDQPIAADYVQFANMKRNFNRNTEAFISRNENTKFFLDDRNINRFRYQDSNVQTDVCYENTCINLNSRSDRLNSQATQVNFNPSRPNPPKGFKNKVAQCYCDISTSENNIFNNNDKDGLQDCKSPLVVISVYPRQDDKDINYSPVKIIQQPIPTQRKVNIPFKGIKGRLKTDNVQSVKKPGQTTSRSRSPSPVNKIRPFESLADKKFDRVSGKNIQLNTNQPQRNVNKSKHKLNSLKKDASCYCPYSEGLGNEEFPKLRVKSRGQNLKESDPKQFKQALVNNFIKSVNGIDQNYAKMKFVAPKTDSSRVAINIDGENERYNVLFEQRDFDTGLSVRKTAKKQSQAHNTQDVVDAKSTENFLMLSNEINRDTPMHSQKPRDVSKVVPKQPGLNVRDSLEICHSRGSRGGLHQNPAQRGKDKLPDSPENSNFKAPGKHYRGDNCSVPDPNERDKEIRQLLGIVRHTRDSKKDEIFNKDHHKVFYSHPDSKKENCCSCKKRNSSNLIRGHSNSSLKRDHGRISKARLKKCGARNIGVGVTVTEALNNKNKKVCNNLPEPFHIRSKERLNDESERCRIHRQGNVCINKNLFTKHFPRAETIEEQKNCMFNRNIQMFLQIEQFTEQKPIILTRQQYKKVKRTIRGAIKHRCCNLNNVNNVSVGEIKIKPRMQQIRYDRDVQTEPIVQSEVQKTVRCMAIQTQHRYKSHRTKTQDEKHNHSRESEEHKTVCALDNTQNEQIKTKLHKTISNAERVNENKPSERKLDKIISISDKNKDKRINNNEIGKNPMTNQILSSMAIHYTNVAYTKRITISSTHFGDGFHNKDNNHEILKPKASTSLHTIFKGHTKSATPNLGTSAYSLCSDGNDSTKSIMGPENTKYAGDSKPKKPFLKRLLSCLVMRTTETTILKAAPERNLPSVNSSVDSYHISTSLGAIEMTSSLYDTSASFYSNHTIAPMKMKRGGFFSSVRGFLMTRRS